jgi:hypothetical protein
LNGGLIVAVTVIAQTKGIVMRKIALTLVAGTLLAVSTSKLTAADTGKETTLTGNMVCAKCVLHETKTCQNVLQVADNGKTNNYYLAQNDVSKNFHDQICTTDGEKATVTGTVSKKGGKEILTASKIEAAK